MKAIIICGPTGSGKSAAAMEIASHYGGSIVSADSRQIYRKLNIGTAKPSPGERREIPHYLIDVADVSEDYTAMKFVVEAISSLELIGDQNRIPLVVGGTGLYIEALTKGIFIGPGKEENIRAELSDLADRKGISVLYDELRRTDPAAAKTIAPNDRVRIIRALEIARQAGVPASVLRASNAYARSDADFLWVGLDMPRETLYERIDSRVDKMISDGLIDEVRGLVDDGLGDQIKRKKIVGYNEIISAMEKGTALDDAVELIKRHTRNYAKRQLTWFRNRTRAVRLDPSLPDFRRKVFSLLDEHLKRA